MSPRSAARRLSTRKTLPSSTARGIPHAVWNAGPEPARMLELSTPGREIEAFFREFDQLSQAGQVSAPAVAELARPYGISYHLDLIPQLEARYGISAGSGWWAR